MSSIFEKDSFTLKELCNIFLSKNIDNINDICTCYINFSSENKKFREYLQITRNNRGLLKISDDKSIYFRELLQTFDHEFNKLVIRISTNPKNYDISIKWSDFENKIKNITKNDIKSFIEE
jgi:hypothetical protein